MTVHLGIHGSSRLALLLTAVLVACGGGGNETHASKSSAETASASAPVGLANARASTSVQALAITPPPVLTAEQLAACAATPFGERTVSDMAAEHPCVVGQYRGQAQLRSTMPSGYPAGDVQLTNLPCTVSIHSDNTARMQVGEASVTVSLNPGDDASFSRLTYGNERFQMRTVTGSAIALRGSWFAPADVGLRSAAFHFNARRYDDVPGWQLEAWAQSSDFPGLDGYQALGCVRVLDDALTPPLTTTLTDAQLKTCPSPLNPVTYAHWSCFSGMLAGIAVRGATAIPLLPRQSCAVWIRPDGMLVLRSGGQLSVQRLESRTWYGLMEHHGSAWFPLWQDATYQVQRLMSYWGETGEPPMTRSGSFIMDIYRHQHHPMALPTISVHTATPGQAGCLAQPI